ncbi:MAG: PSD1 and planctomycete cytochrome C domain-containing protein [Pirellulales bacterium]
MNPLRLLPFPTIAIGILSFIASQTLITSQTFAEKFDEREEFFESKVRPLLLQSCVECHGPDEQSADLRLDQNPLTEMGSVITPGKPDESKLVHSIRYAASAKAMPPDKKLQDDQIAILTKWIADGAYWPKESSSSKEMKKESLPPAKRIDEIREKHWAFKPIGNPAPPSVKNEAWIKQSLDRFVLSKLEQSNLTPSSQADKRTLMLRAYFTLTGLPPTYEQIEAFVADESPQAFEKLIDKLLDDPHYGERWARHWLDIARFAETTGYQAGSVDTTYPYAYTYRDYVIKAFNQDKPYDRFVVEQIAADRLDLKEDQKEALAALGFLTVGRKFMGRVHDIIDDRIDVVTRGFLGLSVTCARCHDHKYDPVPTADYYSLYGIFASCNEPGELPLIGDPNSNPQYQEFLAAKAAQEKEVEQWLDNKRKQTEVELQSRTADYLIYFSKSRPNSGYSGVKQIGERGALRPQAVSRWKRFLADSSNVQQPVWGLWARLVELPAENFKDRAAQLLSTESAATWQANVNQELLNALRQSAPDSMESAAKLIGEKLEAASAKWRELTEKDKSIATLPDASQEQIRQALVDEESPTVLNLDQMRTHLNQAERNEYNQQLGKVKAVESKHPGAPGRAMVVQDNSKPHDPVVFLRGQPGNNGDRVPRRFLQVLAQVDHGKLYNETSGRLELAQAIASPLNPLTARVIVNRVWQQHFGFGLVRTASDFGARGEQPSHPELLDYLASEFMMDGWSIKRLQKRIMLSATWCQCSEHRAEGHSIDPENRLLWHMPRKRLEFEPLRDRWLFAAGTLDQQIGGRSVKIHEDATRRGLYAYVDREDVPSLLAAFDVPSPDASQATRSRTTVPQQALYMINSKFVIDQAKTLSNSTSTVNDIDRIKQLYRKTLLRDPTEDEMQLAKLFVDTSRPALPGASEQVTTESEQQIVWQFGYGAVDETTGKVIFTPLPHFTGDRWQVSNQFPDAKLGHLVLSATGGHPGNRPELATIIRWISQGNGKVSLRGKLKHKNDSGDGVRARVVSSRTGVVATWEVKSQEVNTAVAEITVEAGDTLDFVVDIRQSDNSDSYQWAPIVKVAQGDAKLEAGGFWNYASDFESASKSLSTRDLPVDLWAELAQILLMSNELAFVD